MIAEADLIQPLIEPARDNPNIFPLDGDRANSTHADISPSCVKHMAQPRTVALLGAAGCGCPGHSGASGVTEERRE